MCKWKTSQIILNFFAFGTPYHSLLWLTKPVNKEWTNMQIKDHSVLFLDSNWNILLKIRYSWYTCLRNITRSVSTVSNPPKTQIFLEWYVSNYVLGSQRPSPYQQQTKFHLNFPARYDRVNHQSTQLTVLWTCLNRIDQFRTRHKVVHNGRSPNF